LSLDVVGEGADDAQEEEGEDAERKNVKDPPAVADDRHLEVEHRHDEEDDEGPRPEQCGWGQCIPRSTGGPWTPIGLYATVRGERDGHGNARRELGGNFTRRNRRGFDPLTTQIRPE
jgi:hypothetical protein